MEVVIFSAEPTENYCMNLQLVLQSIIVSLSSLFSCSAYNCTVLVHSFGSHSVISSRQLFSDKKL